VGPAGLIGALVKRCYTGDGKDKSMKNLKREKFSEVVYSMGSHDRAYLDGDLFEYGDGTGDTEPVVNLMLDVGDEALTIVFDAHHLREFRLAVQRAEKWIKEQDR
jgi:hypothetical protein